MASNQTSNSQMTELMATLGTYFPQLNKAYFPLANLYLLEGSMYGVDLILVKIESSPTVAKPHLQSSDCPPDV